MVEVFKDILIPYDRNLFFLLLLPYVWYYINFIDIMFWWLCSGGSKLLIRKCKIHLFDCVEIKELAQHNVICRKTERERDSEPKIKILVKTIIKGCTEKE